MSSSIKIAPTAIVCQDAKLSGTISIGAGTIIQPRAEIRAEGGPIRIGENNIIEELVVIQNTKGSGKETAIGNDNLFEVGSQVAAEKIGDANVFECRSFVPANTVIGSGCAIGTAVQLKHNVSTTTEQQPSAPLVIEDNVAYHGPQAIRLRVDNAKENHLAMHSKHLEVLSKTLPTFHRMLNANGAPASPAKP